jgi:sugar transferase (PEP-CTERM/EpsH1 system associated)
VEPLLLLTHRIPYPPNKGDKIRSFHLLKFLSRYFDIYLGTFVDDPEDRRYSDKLKQFTVDQCVIEINPAIRKAVSLGGLLKNSALSIAYYASPTLQNWVDKVIAKNNIKHAYIMTSPMAQFIENQTQMKLVADYVDLDSEKWRQLSEHRHGLSRWILQREHALLSQYENRVAKSAEQVCFASQVDTVMFNQRVGNPQASTLSNGVDSDFFNPGLDFDNPYPRNKKIIVFTGVMNYWINSEAVKWFCKEVLPEITLNCPDTLFYIVGAKPNQATLSLGTQANVKVTGKVGDIRPYLKHADVVTVPVRTECGFKNKLFEALAMEKPVVATSKASNCLDPEIQAAISVEDDALSMARKIIARLASPIDGPGPRATSRLLKNRYNWNSMLSGLLEHFNLQSALTQDSTLLERSA